MTLSSMTGFARTEGHIKTTSGTDYNWTWEIRTVNGRGLDVRCKIPSGLDAFDQYIKNTLKKHLSRGSVNVNLVLSQEGDHSTVKINHHVLGQLVEAAVDTSVKFHLPQPSIDSFFAIRDVMEITDESLNEETQKERDEALKASFLEAVASLKSARLDEGGAIKEILSATLDEIETHLKEGEAIAAKQPESLKEKFLEKVNNLLSDDNRLDADRVTQEIVILATKADVKEETDRLHAHISSARNLIEEKGQVGRKLDFLCQEFNREANTLCSKSSSIELTNIGLSLKTAIDQLREQIQNIE
jgi:uncharacterized protein (TIGR00255 family)